MRKLRVYVSGPISGGDQVRNVINGINIGQSIWDMGAVPFVPHLSLLTSIVAPGAMDYEDWMTFDFAWLEVCDAVYRIPGVSPGADRELDYAYSLGIPVFLVLSDLKQYLEKVSAENPETGIPVSQLPS